MRVDYFLSTVGVVKRRTVAKQLAQNCMVEINCRTAKASHQVKARDVVHIKGARPVTVEILDIPTGSVPKSERDKYFRQLNIS